MRRNIKKYSKFSQLNYFIIFKLKSIFFKSFRNPILGGIKLTDICNLKCLHCPFWRKENKTSMGWEDVKSIIKEFNSKGVRIVVFEGGEPLLWKDAKHNKDIKDVLDLASKYFFYTAVTTNGTIDFSQINCSVIFISVDGTKNIHDLVRGKSFEKINENIEKNNKNKKIILNITLGKYNIDELKPIVEFFNDKVFGFTLQFFYRYDGLEDLSLNISEKQLAAKEAAALKKAGYKILDSYSALKSMPLKKFNCRDFLVASADPDASINYGCYLKNRSKNIDCSSCGFFAHCELSLAFDLKTDALICAKKIFWEK